MADITTLFFDPGGVLLTNGWDRQSRRHCVESFGLDYAEIRDRHEFVSDAFETGRMTIDEYLDRTVFYRTRDFSRDSFREGMVAESKPFPDAPAVAERLAASGRYLLATLNVITMALMSRIGSRDEVEFSDRVLSALRGQFGGHAVKQGDS